ncbi:hypothetical protein [Gottfriedia acidiceleris]|uniref:hypothetical protein n=1 Tax=Gottfriedia acidiceleris TaxID=371036 RepID=UPI002FFF5BE7
MNAVFKDKLEIKHMFEGWTKVEATKLYDTNWVVCEKKRSRKVFTQTGKDIAKLNDQGKISYLENVPDDSNMFDNHTK